MLAGRMKLRTFVMVVAGGIAVACAGIGAARYLGASSGERVSAAPPSPPLATAGTVGRASTGTPDDAARPWDATILSRRGQSLGADKVKDAEPGQAWKVNLYQDAGSATMNRAKVDYDRDEKWDESWRIAADEVVRKVAPADDEQYTEVWRYAGDRWLRDGAEGGGATAAEGSAQPPPTPAPTPTAGAGSPTPASSAAPAAGTVAARAWDSAVLAWQGKALGTDKKKDVTSGKPYKVNVYQDAGEATANRAKVDLDRDEKWDEKWTFKNPIEREVAPADDEAYTEVWVWDGSGWRRK